MTWIILPPKRRLFLLVGFYFFLKKTNFVSLHSLFQTPNLFPLLSCDCGGVPLLDSQTVLPPAEILISLKHWYCSEYGDFLIHEKPNFFVGLVWLELLFQWPLALLNLYALLGSKPWFNTTCLIYGVSVFTAMAAILPEMVWSGKASDKLLLIDYPFMGIGVLSMIRGLMPNSRKNGGGGGVTLVGRRTALGRKKKA